jgi:hypothetical protein
MGNLNYLRQLQTSTSLFPSRFRSDCGAGAALSSCLPVLLSSYHQIVTCKLVTVLAVCLGSVCASRHIDLLSDGFEVVGVDADASSAQVVENQTLWYYLYKQLVHQFVGVHLLTIVGYFAVASVVGVSKPVPAVRTVKEVGRHNEFGVQALNKFVVKFAFHIGIILAHHSLIVKREVGYR